MAIYQQIPRPSLHLFRLTLQLKSKLWNVYSMGESVEDAFNSYIAGVLNRKDSASGIELMDGDLANPHAKLHS
jgi:hypothetical protein